MEKEIRVAFPISTTKIAQDREKGETTVEEIAGMLLAEAAAHASEGSEQFLHELRAASGSLRLADRSKRVLALDKSFYKPYHLNEVQFLAAQVEHIEVYGYKDCYAKVAYADNGAVYRGTVILPAEMFYRFFDSGVLSDQRPMYLVGTCIRKEYKKSAKRTYNKYMMKTVTVSEAKVVKRTKMIQFHICNLPEAK